MKKNKNVNNQGTQKIDLKNLDLKNMNKDY